MKGDNMSDNPELIESTEIAIYELLKEAHIKGLSYERCEWVIDQVKTRCALLVDMEIALIGKSNTHEFALPKLI